MMDRALKERIIGAVILVSVAVIVVPVFLDGPPSEEAVVSHSVALPGQSAQNTQTIVLERDREEPVPASQAARQAEPQPDAPTSVPDSVPRSTPSATVERPQAESRAPEQEEPTQVLPKPVEPAASATGMWAVQLGSFGDKKNAERLAADLRKQGFAAFLSKLATSSGELHRVRVGPQKDRESAEAMARRLQAAGHKGQVIPHP